MAATRHTERTSGEQQQLINTGTVLADAVRTTFGPNGMDKMLVGRNGTVLVTNDGARILDRMEIEDPVATTVARAASSQQVATTDGTTRTVLLTGALLSAAESLLAAGVHPTTIIDGFNTATYSAREQLQSYGVYVDEDDREMLKNVARTAVTGRWDDANTRRFAELTVGALEAIEFDRSRLGIGGYAGGELRDSTLIDGMCIDMEQSPATAGGWGRDQTVRNARVAMVNTAISIDKPAAVEVVTLADSEQASRFREHEAAIRSEIVGTMCDSGVDVLFCQKSIDEQIRNALIQRGVLPVERTRQDQFDAITAMTGAKAVQSVGQFAPTMAGHAGTVRHRTVGTTETVWVTDSPAAVHRFLLLRGGTPHVAAESERIIETCSDAVTLAVNEGRVVPGGGASMVSLSRALRSKAKSISDREQLVIEAYADALETLPQALAKNAGRDPMATLAELKRRHAGGDKAVGVGPSGTPREMVAAGVVEPRSVIDRSLTIALEAASMLLRVDEVLSADTAGADGQSGSCNHGGRAEHSCTSQPGVDAGGYPWAISH